MSVRLAFCSDCDLQTFSGYREIHAFMDRARLPAGDSFWLFDPSGGEMGLFRSDCSEKGPFHDELLEEIRTGRIDVLHSAGSYGAPFNRGFRPERRRIGQALEYLAKHAVVPRIWTNHGDDQNVQNVGGAYPNYYHRGDELGADAYILDMLLEYGFEYFWTDHHIVRPADVPKRLVAYERARSGQTIRVFSRFMGDLSWSPNGQNLARQINEQNLQQWIANGQNVILYQHWGCHHDDQRRAYSPQSHPLTEETQAALTWLSEQQDLGRISVVPLKELLDEEAAKPKLAETDRVARIIVAKDENPDGHHRYQVETHTLPYFAERVEFLDPRGRRALDAGCGIGQWSLFLTDRFHVVDGFDNDAGAIAMANSIAAGARLPASYAVRDIYDTGLVERSYDFVVCYGVIFLVDALRALRELFRVMTHGGQIFLSVNGDSWYVHLVLERFADEPDSKRRIFIEPLWNAYVARCGGQGRLGSLALRRHRDLVASIRGRGQERAPLLKSFLSAAADPQAAALIDSYGEYIRADLIRRLEYFGRSVGGGTVLTTVRRLPGVAPGAAAVADDPLPALPLRNRPYLPSEFKAVAAEAGFGELRWRPDAGLSLTGKDPAGAPRVLNAHAWECVLRSPW
jgi:SAM-dependent methyltransferase